MRLLAFVIFLLPLYAQEWDKMPVSSIRFVNRVSACMALKPVALIKPGAPLIALKVSTTSTKSTGECGCRSALLRYRVVEGSDQKELASASFSTLAYKTGSQGSVTLVLTGDGSIPYRQPVVVNVECEP